MNVRQTFLCSLLLMPGVGAGVTTISAALPNVVQQQQKGIKASGTVVDNENNPLIGATVTVKGTKTIAITDMDGHFYSISMYQTKTVSWFLTISVLSLKR